MGYALYGEEDETHIEVNYVDRGNDDLEPLISIVYPDMDESISIWWNDLRDCLKLLKEDDPELFDRLING